MTQDVEDILNQLRESPTDEPKEQVAEDGAVEESVAVAPKVTVQDLAKTIGSDQKLADKLWKTDEHEARMLAVLIADPEKATAKSILKWAKDVQTVDLADQIARFLVPKTQVAIDVIDLFAASDVEYVKRIGFGSIACTAIHSPHQRFEVLEGWLKRIVDGAEDERESVQKGILWALVEIGKLDEEWQDAAIVTAYELQAEGPFSAALGHEAEQTLSASDRRRQVSGNSKNASNQSQGQGQGQSRGRTNNNNGRNNNNRNDGRNDGRNNNRTNSGSGRNNNSSNRNSNTSNRNNSNTGSSSNNSDNNPRGRGGSGGQQNSQNAEGGSDANKPARRNGRNKRRSRPSTPKPE